MRCPACGGKLKWIGDYIPHRDGKNGFRKIPYDVYECQECREIVELPLD